VDFREDILQYGASKSVREAFSRSSAADPKLLSSHTVHGRSIGNWRKVLTPDEVARILDALGEESFTALGYETQLDEGAQYAGVPRTRLSAHGRLDEFSDRLDHYPQSVVEGLALDPPLSWLNGVFLAKQAITTLVSEGDNFILVDGNQLGLDERISGRRHIPFLERAGEYWGPPPDDRTAIAELERLRRSGAGQIVFAWPAFWWLDYYQGLRRHLETSYRCVRRDERLIAYDLRT
jgi:hypothetical protein